MEPGSLSGLQLVVNDLQKAHDQLSAKGVTTSKITHMGANRPDFDGHELDNIGFIFFNDPDGNQWAIQQISNRP